MAKSDKKEDEKCKNWRSDCGGGCLYFLGVIGAAVYYLQTSTGFWGAVLALLKALVWPALLVYKLLGL